MAEDKDKAALLLDLMKEQTGALAENTRAMRALIMQIAGAPPETPDGEPLPGLMERLADLGETIDELGEAVEELDTRMTGMNLKLSGVEYVLDELSRIAEGDPAAVPPVPGRTPIWADAVAAKRRYDEKVESEMIAAAEHGGEAPEEPPEGQTPATGPEETPSRPTMIANAPRPALPPLPVAPPRP